MKAASLGLLAGGLLVVGLAIFWGTTPEMQGTQPVAPSAPVGAAAAIHNLGEPPVASETPTGKSGLQISTDPVPDATLKIFENAIKQQFALFFESAGLDAATQAKLVAVLANKGARLAAIVRLNSDKDQKQLVEPMQQVRDQAEKEVATILGEQKYAQLTEFRRTSPIREMIGSFNSILAGSGTPLAAGQSDALKTIVSDELNGQYGQAMPMSNMGEPRLALESLTDLDRILAAQPGVDARILSRASTVLTPEQVKVLEGMMQQRLMGFRMGRDSVAQSINASGN